MNVNKAIIAGNLTRDPEARTTTSGQLVASFGVATNRIWNDRSGQRQKQAEFHNVVVWGKLAEICQKYLSKGRLVYIEGRLQTRTWQDQAGNKKNRTEIIAERMQMGPRTAGTAVSEPTPEEAPPAEETEAETPPQTEEEINVEEIPF